MRDKSATEVKSGLAVLTVANAPIPRKSGLANDPKLPAYTSCGTDQQIAKDASKKADALQRIRCRAKRFKRENTKLKKGGMTNAKSRAAISNAVAELNKAAEKMGAHVVLVHGACKGKKVRVSPSIQPLMQL